jgi:hypothetical protein
MLPHPSWFQIFSLEPCSQTLSVYALPLLRETKFHTHTIQLAELGFVYFKLHIHGKQEERRETSPFMEPEVSLPCLQDTAT